MKLSYASTMTTLLVVSTLVSSLLAFTPSSKTPKQQQQQRSSRCSQLRLVPEQGNQLVAAYTAALSKYEDISDDDDDYEEEDDDDVPRMTTTATNRNFVQRAFSIPSPTITNNKKRSIKRDSFTTAISTTEGSGDDVVIFPLVGFTFCQNGNRVVALPTQSNVSCRLPRSKTSRAEEIYGWYSPVCKLNLYAPMDEEYCQAPPQTTTTTIAK